MGLDQNIVLYNFKYKIRHYVILKYHLIAQLDTKKKKLMEVDKETNGTLF